MAELTPDAQAAIRDAVRIVQEDKRDKMIREMHAKAMTPATPPADPAVPPTVPPVNPPPVVDPAVPPVVPPKKDAYWGELLS